MAYAAVISAKQKIERLLDPSQPRTLVLKPFYAELCSLESVLQECGEMLGSKLRFDRLEQQIEDVVDQIEDLMESFISSGEVLSISESKHTLLIFSRELLKVIQEIPSLKEKLNKYKEKYSMMEVLQQQDTADDDVSSRIYDFGRPGELVGLDAEVGKLLRWMFGGSSLQVMAVVGMVGIGKTTLVEHVFTHPSVVRNFNSCYLLTVGPNYTLEEFAVQFLNRLGVREKMGLAEFAMYIAGHLWYSRYLIVLDDIWSTEVWGELQELFPDKENGSRIILTSRLLDVARYEWIAETHEKCFLKDEDSWSLLRRTVFTSPEEHCSYHLEKFGRKIAKKCEGLPLAILAIGKHLRTAEKTVEYWEEVSERENLQEIIKDDYSKISNSLVLSYKMLPRRLKECFLYVGIIPKYEIAVATLLKLWRGEGFFVPGFNKSLEDTGVMYLWELVNQSVVLVREQSIQLDGIKVCGVHFIFRYLCVTEAENENFCLVVKKYADTIPRGANWKQRLSIHNNVLFGIKQAQDNMESISGVRSLLCLGPSYQHVPFVSFNFKLLKVLNALSIRFYKFPHHVLKLIRLKHLAITYHGEIPESISQLRNLEVLIVGRFHWIISTNARALLPVEIWDLNCLKHLQCMGIDLPDPCPWAKGLELMTLSGVSARSCSWRILPKVSKLDKLGVCIELAPGEVQSLNFFLDVAQELHNLRSFKCVVRDFHGIA